MPNKNSCKYSRVKIHLPTLVFCIIHIRGNDIYEYLMRNNKTKLPV